MATASQQVILQEPGLTFDSLVKRHSRFVFGVAFAILRNPQDAEEAAQETFLKLAKAVWRIAVDHLPRKREALSRPLQPLFLVSPPSLHQLVHVAT